MSLSEGYINIWRKIQETAFYKNPNACHLAVHFLIKANWKDTAIIFNNKELVIKRGEHLSGRKVLSQETGLTEREIRTSITILENVHFLTSRTTNRFTIFSICKYDDYQSQTTSTSPNKRPTSDQQVTTPNNDNNEKNNTPLPPKGDGVEITKDPTEQKLIKFLKDQTTIKEPEGYLRWIITKYGKEHLTKLMTVNFKDWKEHLEFWENEKNEEIEEIPW